LATKAAIQKTLLDDQYLAIGQKLFLHSQLDVTLFFE
jgi:hypothetical protein